MSGLVIVGAQWGDEAKGKIVDVLSDRADFVVRYSGGNNAGHTVLVDGREFRFHLLPAGILHPQVTAVLGGAMVVCPESLLEEYDSTRAAAGAMGELVVSPAAHVVFPYHRTLDALEEDARGANRIGTTSRGIGPAYQDKVARIGIRIGELIRPEVFRERLNAVLTLKNKWIRALGGEPLDFDSLYERYRAYGERIAPFVRDVPALLSRAVAEDRFVLFEGAQGTFLDLDAGTYPYVTSSVPTAGGACLGTGVGPLDIGAVLGVTKAYATRVGGGPFPTELEGEAGAELRERGSEYGTTTGRGRRCGWLDLVALRHSCRLNSLSGLVVTRLDVLSGYPEIPVCVEYELDGAPIATVPSLVEDLERVRPVYKTLRGWKQDLRGCRTVRDLPEEAREYVRFIEEATRVPVVMISVGPDREETIFVPDRESAIVFR